MSIYIMSTTHEYLDYLHRLGSSMYVCTHVNVHACKLVCMYARVFLHMYVCTHVNLHACKLVCMYARVFLHMYVGTARWMVSKKCAEHFY